MKKVIRMEKSIEDCCEWLVMAYAMNEDLQENVEWWSSFKGTGRIQITIDRMLSEYKLSEVEGGAYMPYTCCGCEEEDAID